MIQQTGAEMFSLLNLRFALQQDVYSSRTFLMSQQVGIALFLITLIRSQQKLLAVLVSTFTENIPGLVPVKAKTLPAIEQLEQMYFPSRQQSRVTSSSESSSHISKSRFLPCITSPSRFLTRKAVHMGMVENSQKKLKKNIFSKGKPLSLARASTQATKSWYLNSFLAQNSTPSQKVLGMGSKSSQSMKRVSGFLQSLQMGAHLTSGESLSSILQTLGTCESTGPTCGTTVAQVRATSSATKRKVRIF